MTLRDLISHAGPGAIDKKVIILAEGKSFWLHLVKNVNGENTLYLQAEKPVLHDRHFEEKKFAHALNVVKSAISKGVDNSRKIVNKGSR